MAPDATLTLVNYHTELEFEQAVDWLVHGPDGHPRVDIVVHSNSFLDGPFDGTGETAHAVDAAHAAGILWVNSVGNYARRHWSGRAGDLAKGVGSNQPFFLGYQGLNDRDLQARYGSLVCRIMAEHYPPATLPESLPPNRSSARRSCWSDRRWG